MKTRNASTQEMTTPTGACCGPTENTQANVSQCYEQPTDGTSCCDKTASKEVNSKQTGCC